MRLHMKLLYAAVIVFSGHANATGWEYWDVEAIDGTTRLGCESSGGQVSLDGLNFRLGNDDELTFDTFRIYARLDGGIKRIRLVTPDCAVPEMRNLERVERSPAESLDYLQAQLAVADRRLASEIIMAIAHHADAEASRMLIDLAAAGEEKYWSPAIFWLPVRRGEAGVATVEAIIRESDSIGARKHAVFPYALGAGEAAAGLLKQVIQEDDSSAVRAQALFALAQTDAPGLEPFMAGIAAGDDTRTVRQQALFALSVLGTDASVDALIEFSRDPGNGSLRREALFWLANTDVPEAEKELIGILED